MPASPAALAICFWQDGPARLLVFAILYAAGGMAARPCPHRLSVESSRLWLGRVLGVMQAAALIGAYGLSFLTILLGASLAEFCQRAPHGRAARRCSAVRRLWAYGAFRLADTPSRDRAGCHGAAGAARYSAGRKICAPLCRAQLAAAARSHRRARASHPSSSGRKRRRRSCSIARASRAGRDRACSPAGGRTPDHRRGARSALGRQVSFYNSLFIFGPGGKPVAVYDKFHLVPFGEYVPFASMLNRIGITKLTDGQDGFSAGDGPHTYQVPGAPAGHAADLLRNHLSRRGDSASAPGLVRQCHRRFLVRPMGRARCSIF